MKPGSALSRIRCGLFAVIVSGSLVGCANVPSINRPMFTEDINAMRIDCANRDKQIQMLLNQLSTRDDRLFAWWTNYIRSWDQHTSQSDDYHLRRSIAGQQNNWQINQMIYLIRKFCG